MIAADLSIIIFSGVFQSCRLFRHVCLSMHYEPGAFRFDDTGDCI